MAYRRQVERGFHLSGVALDYLVEPLTGMYQLGACENPVEVIE